MFYQRPDATIIIITIENNSRFHRIISCGNDDSFSQKLGMQITFYHSCNTDNKSKSLATVQFTFSPALYVVNSP